MIEKTTKYATTVGDLPSAWAFVMEHLDTLGPDPTIEIRPFRSYNVHDMDLEDPPTPPRQFGVVISGTVDQPGIARESR